MTELEQLEAQLGTFDRYAVQEDHAKLVKALSKPGEQMIKEITPEEAHLLHMAVGVAGEAGELLDAIKKQVIYRKPLDIENVVEEIGDLFFYIQGILNSLIIDPDLCKLHNMRKLKRRYDAVYSNQAAIERADKNDS